LHELVTNGSICRVVVEKGILDHPLINDAARADRSFAEEVQALANERDWRISNTRSYAWSLMANFADPTPRIRRILDRDVFELRGMARETDDDDVASLALQLCSDRRTLKRELEAENPSVALPGAK
jgi:hypothetical protein